MTLFTPLTIGAMELPNRIVMAPLTRVRSSREGVPGPLVVEHYRQRASLGLIVTEGTYPSDAGRGFPGQPGLVTAEQLAGWRNVTTAVHDAGGRVFAQVMHAGRVTHEATTGGHTVVAPSAVAINGETRTYDGKLPYPVPHALTTDELPGVIDEFVQASRNAIDAGMDGVELHGANGYLLHQFMFPETNQRDDGYGGSPANRARFMAEVVQAVVAAVGAERVGLRISPGTSGRDVLPADPDDILATYGAMVDAIAPLNLAYLSVLHEDPAGSLIQGLRSRFGGPFLVNSGFGVITDRDEAESILASRLGDAVVVGRQAIANPDLARRWQEGLPLNEPDPATYYSHGAEGYIDYPFYEDVLAEATA
ncbi:alkene reductase [Arthrobacter sp. Bz4]|uniref:alkene reductase n=1 Tax=Arthrobacter sp. Bz4 TaxID=2171979 RepID=UPI000D520A7F|nr:alkene reductase [Arthrobacter sp. Bz4]PVE15496.1 alkene reductase [Arthrobacter sp. Bz4]